MGQPLRFTPQPRLGCEFAGEDFLVGKTLGEGEQQAIDLGPAVLRGKPRQRLGQDLGISFLAVARNQGMAEFVDKPHGIQGAGVDLAFGIGNTPVFPFAQRIECESEPASGSKVRKDDIAGIAEEEVADVQPRAKRPRDMKLHVCTPPTAGARQISWQAEHFEGISPAPSARERHRTRCCPCEGRRALVGCLTGRLYTLTRLTPGKLKARAEARALTP